MKPFYDIAGVSKQAHQQHMKKRSYKRDRTEYYLRLMDEARIMHPAIGLAKIYYLYFPEGIGREAFEQLGRMMGYALERKPVVSWKGARIIPHQNLQLAGRSSIDSPL